MVRGGAVVSPHYQRAVPSSNRSRLSKMSNVRLTSTAADRLRMGAPAAPRTRENPALRRSSTAHSATVEPEGQVEAPRLFCCLASGEDWKPPPRDPHLRGPLQRHTPAAPAPVHQGARTRGTHPGTSPVRRRTGSADGAVRGPRDQVRRPAPERGPVPALLVEHVTKRFVVGRKKKPVTAVDDVSIAHRARRGRTASSAPTAAASRRSSGSSAPC